MERHLLLSRFAVRPVVLVVCLVVFRTAGFVSDALGRRYRIAWFPRRWHVLTCYGLYMVSCALFVRGLHWFDQYRWVLFLLVILEFAGCKQRKGFIDENNIVARLFRRADFSLRTLLISAAHPPHQPWTDPCPVPRSI